MTCAPELSGWAGRILEYLPETGFASTGSIVSYLKFNLSKLNNAIYTDFILSGECIVPDMNQAQSGIYQQMYFCDYLAKRAIQSIGAAAYEWIEIEGHDQGRMRRTAQTTVAQSFRLEANSCKAELQSQIDNYNEGQFTTIAGMVVYQDRGPNACIMGPFGERTHWWNYCP